MLITYVLDVVLNLKIGIPRITQVDGQPTRLLPYLLLNGLDPWTDLSRLLFYPSSSKV